MVPSTCISNNGRVWITSLKTTGYCSCSFCVRYRERRKVTMSQLPLTFVFCCCFVSLYHGFCLIAGESNRRRKKHLKCVMSLAAVNVWTDILKQRNTSLITDLRRDYYCFLAYQIRACELKFQETAAVKKISVRDLWQQNGQRNTL